MSQVFKFRKIRKLQIEGVHNDPSIGIENVEHSPEENHDYVVRKYKVVHSGEEDPSKDSKNGKYCKGVQPWHHFFLVFLKRNETMTIT